MCGITGIVAGPKQLLSENQLMKAISSLSHRGPDGTGIWVSSDKKVGLGHTRLAVIELSDSGSQPMVSNSGRYKLSYNGETYNFKELRADLAGKGANFRGNSDTEVILAGFEQWGVPETLKQMSGMFALAVWDEKDKYMYLARDRVGIKPLYFSMTNDTLIFGSELKSVAILLGKKPGICKSGLTDFLQFGYISHPMTIFEGINKLEPGHFLKFKSERGGVSKAFWRLNDSIKIGLENQFQDSIEATHVLEKTLNKSVQRHLIADVSTGAFLSGGIDSSLIVSLMQKNSLKSINTFSIGFHEKEYNEADIAKNVAHVLGTNHNELYVTDRDAMDVIPSIPFIYDEPFADISQIPTYLVSQLARKTVTVCLSGDGGDELFSGYNRYLFVNNFWQRIQNLPLSLRKLLSSGIGLIPASSWDRIFQILEPVLPESLNVPIPGQKIHKAARAINSSDIVELQKIVTSQWAVPELILLKEWRVQNENRHNDLFEIEGITEIQRQMAFDIQSYLANDILTKVDRASMSVGLEARVPFLDPDVIDASWRVPESMRIRDQKGKWIIRDLLSEYVPKKYFDRPKMGFSVPIDDWIRDKLKDWVFDTLESASFEKELIFNKHQIREILGKHQAGQLSAGGQIWTLLMFAKWKESSDKWVL